MRFDQLFWYILLSSAVVFGRRYTWCVIRWAWVSSLFLGLYAAPLQAQQDTSGVAKLEYKLQTAESPVQKAQILLDLFEKYKRKDLDKASLYNDQVLAMIPDQVKQKELWAHAYLNRAFQLFVNYELEKASIYCFKAINTVSEAEQPLLHADAYNRLAALNWELGDLNKNLEYGYKGLTLIKDQTLESTKMRLIIRYNLGLTYIDLDQLEKAKYMVKQNSREVLYHKLNVHRAADFDLLLQIASLKNQYALVIKYALESIKLRASDDIAEGNAIAYTELCNVYTKLKNEPKSIYYLHKASKLSEASQDVFFKINVIHLHAKYHLSHGQLESAVVWVKQGIAMAEKNGTTQFHFGLFNTQARILEKMGRIQEALEALRKYHFFNERTKIESIKQRTQQQFANYQLTTRQEKINQRYLKKIQAEKQKRSLGIAAFVFALIIGGVVLLLYRHRLRNHRVLLQKQQLIAEQAEALRNLNEQKTQLFGTIASKLGQPMAEIRQDVNQLKPGVVPVQEQKILDELREHTGLAISAFSEVLKQTRTMIGEENYFEG